MTDLSFALAVGLLTGLLPGGIASADETLIPLNPEIHCEAIKHRDGSSGRVSRGVSVFYETRIKTSSGSSESTGKKFVREFWFNESVSDRNQALIACQRGKEVLECRQDGPLRSSYLGPASPNSRDWALHGPGVAETFRDPMFFGDSAFLQCKHRIIELISSSIQQLQ